jgi:D-serine deaminase-like pyridoxal phosphate-dependent protein
VRQRKRVTNLFGRGRRGDSARRRKPEPPAAAPLTFRSATALHQRGWDERRQAIAQAADKAGRSRDLLARNGIACPNITGAGIGIFEFESAGGVYTELQCGSYIFMDADYGYNLDRDCGPTKGFEPSLFVRATVMSRPTEDARLSTPV